MMNLRALVHKLVLRFLGMFGSGFANPQFPPRLLLKHVILQKVLRINAHVPWPVHWTTHVIAPENIQRGTRAPGLSHGCHLDARNGIIFGKNVWVGPRVSIISMNHDICNYHRYQPAQPIVIGDNCWLGANAIILPGVRLGNHVVVAAGAVVTHSFTEDDILLAGIPARIIKRLPPYEENADDEPTSPPP
ncbi:MAG: acyltransferase [Chloroflexi bacterium]|nr:acyltransferase [Chloroflexota bacterium]